MRTRLKLVKAQAVQRDDGREHIQSTRITSEAIAILENLLQ